MPTNIEMQFYNSVIDACRKIRHTDKWEERLWERYSAYLNQNIKPETALNLAKNDVAFYKNQSDM